MSIICPVVLVPSKGLVTGGYLGPNDPVGSPGPWEQIRVQRKGRKVGENMDKKVLKRSEYSLVTSHTCQARLEGSYGVCR